MNEIISCPYNGECPQVINNSNEIKILNERMTMQDKYIIEKINDIGEDVKSLKIAVGDDLNKRIDERIEGALNKQKALILKWLIGVAVSSGTLGSVLTLLFH